MDATKIFDYYMRLAIKALDMLGVSEIGQVTFRKRTLYLLKFETIRNERFKKQGLLPDGLPSPPPPLMFMVYGGFDKEGFYNESGDYILYQMYENANGSNVVVVTILTKLHKKAQGAALVKPHF